jgi:lipopolysaccharide transport system permease protein
MSQAASPINPLTPVPPGDVPHLTIRPPHGWAAMNLIEVWRFRDLLFTLAARDLKLRYKQTALGVIWVVLQPLIGAVIFAVVFGVIANLPSDGVPYFLFCYAGMLGWNLFSGVLSRSSNCLTGNSNLISKVFFPRLVLPLSTVGSVLVDYLVALVVLAVMMPIYHFPPTWALLLLPIWTAALIMLALGIGLFAAALTVTYRDVQYILPVATNILLWASPVAYSAAIAAAKLGKISPKLNILYFANPLAGLLEAFRWSILGTHAPSAGSLIYSIAVCFAAMWIGAMAFKQMERQFADII